MAIQSHDLGGIKLSGGDADTFVRQVSKGKRSAAAERSLARGRALLKQLSRTGKATVPAGAARRGK